MVCVFITAGPITKLFAGGGRRRVDDMCYDRRRAEACVDESARHALANAGGREIVGKKEGEQKGSARGSVHWGCYYATALDIEVDGLGLLDPIRDYFESSAVARVSDRGRLTEV